MTPPVPCGDVPHWDFVVVAVVLGALAAGLTFAPVPRTRPEDAAGGRGRRPPRGRDASG
ncbi:MULTISPECIES: hypothetical protein [unclassified Streptomyces]|uniref:hypothetical protein n=1 Tax=unclassified Streptomyces TaxID=2593676 RepID=UPI002DD86222|nr:hypothetical protein [Streptomyces sp. NBC_01237]WRZ74024.1 hypothetical protein OG251_21710 [Streptomyces sp. NBC_01237]